MCYYILRDTYNYIVCASFKFFTIFDTQNSLWLLCLVKSLNTIKGLLKYLIRDRTDLIHFSKRIASCKIYGISLWRFLQNISKNWILDIHSKYCPQNQTIVEVKHY